MSEQQRETTGACECHGFESEFTTGGWSYCPLCGRKLVAHLLTPRGDAARHVLVSERLKLRRDA